MENRLKIGQTQNGTRNVGSASNGPANVHPAQPIWPDTRPEFMPPWTQSTQNQRGRPSFDMKSILRKQMLDQQQLQDYEANARSSAQPENLPENEMLRFHERQNPERPELRGRPINFGFIDKILQVKRPCPFKQILS